MVYVLCDGDISKRSVVLGMTYPEAVEWLSFKKYESYKAAEE